jgi:hypothetical protein
MTSLGAYHRDHALALNPSYDLVVVQMGELFTWLGQAERRLDPQGDEAQSTIRHVFGAILAKPTSWVSVCCSDRSLHAHGKPRHTSARFPGGIYAWLGDKTAAGAHVGRMRELDGTLDLERFWRRCTSRVSRTCNTCRRDA